MRQIELTQGKIALVDDEDAGRVSLYPWHAVKIREEFYAATTISGRRMYLHRFITEAPRGFDVDHVNHDGLDNRRKNLRVCTHQQNLVNQKKQSGRSSRYKGVTWDKSRNRWRAQTKVLGRAVYLGYFRSEIQAAGAYDNFMRDLHGEYALLNLAGWR